MNNAKDPTTQTVTKASEKESFGEMLSWNMLAAGIMPHTLDNRCLRWDSGGYLVNNFFNRKLV